MEQEDSDSDEQLMLAYGAGDAGAFERLYARYRGPLYRFVLRQTDPGRVDELFQDIWMKVIHARTGYRERAKFRTWLYRIARNRIIDHYRSNRLRAVRDETPVENIEDTGARNPETHTAIMDQHRMLLDALGDLPDEQREAFLLHEEGGLDIHAIAETTGTSYETAKSRLRYAIGKLRERLESFAGDAA